MTKLCVTVLIIVFSEIASAQSTIQVDQTGNINLSTTPPASSSGGIATQAPSPLAVQPTKGGGNTGSTGAAGNLGTDGTFTRFSEPKQKVKRPI